jgi:hypothetical protein
MQIQKRTMNWVPKLSAWDEVQAANAKRREMTQGYMSDSSSFANGLAAVRNAGIANVSTLAKYAVQARVSKLA